ncbi:MAG: hypothetical protein DRP83_01905 [Planctomycetota bacterium]|nr:MAG: hypothetical protein DRP83_01905 [Planctomycetota bacterium]
MAMDKRDESVINLLQGARAEPPRMSAETELPTLFGAPHKEDPLIAKDIEDLQPGRKVRMVSFTKTFILWRPWEKCDRCKAMLAEERIKLPEVGDWTCPHVQVVDYKEVKDKTLRGEGLKEFEEHFQLHDGTRCVQFSWLETDPEYLEEMKKKAEEATKNRVYPPNPEAAFAALLNGDAEESPDQKETPEPEES